VSLTLVTPPVPFISAVTAKARLPALAGVADAVVMSLVAAATAAAEAYLGRALGQQTWDWKPDLWNGGPRVGWPWPYLQLPMPPLVSVGGVKYLDAANVEQTFDQALYYVTGVGWVGRIWLKSIASWPAMGDHPEPLTVRFTAGYSAVPEPLQWAVLMAASDLYSATGRDPAIRSESVEGVGSTSYVDATAAAEALGNATRNSLAPYRVFA
jgi:uncharacterized phiE125 gp8 family phage protein